MLLFILLSALISLAVLCPRSAHAHGVGYRVLEEGTAVTVEFNYSSGEPMSYAAVKVFSPLDGKIEHQNGRTDRRGRFAFYPDTPGEWRMEASDGLGHKTVAKLQTESKKQPVKAPSPSAQTGSPSPEPASPNPQTAPLGSQAVQVLLGVSLICNVCLALYCRRKRPRKEG